MNIYDVADKCYVSRSSVRRFCQSIGYENFKNLKCELKGFNEMFEQYIMPYDVTDFQIKLKQQINEVIEEVNINFSDSVLNDIVQKIHNSEQVVFLAADPTNARVKNFQKYLHLYGKTIRLVSDVFMDEGLLKSLDKKDLLLVVSASGWFAYAARNAVKSCNARSILITDNKNEEFNEYYKEIRYITNKEFKDIDSLYVKYGVDYLIDVIFSTYVRKYSADSKYNIKY